MISGPLTTPYLLRDKLTLCCAFVLVLASITSTSLILGFWFKQSRSDLIRHYHIVAEQSAHKLSETLEGDRSEEADEFLSSFQDHPEVVGIQLLKLDGEVFADYYIRGPGPPPATDKSERLLISEAVFVGDRQMGNVVFIVSLERLRSATYRTAMFLFGVTLFCLFVAVAGIYGMLQKLSQPISSLSETARLVAENQDYSIRTHKYSDDELGKLADSFNHMLATIEKQTMEIDAQAERLSRSKRMEGLGLLAGGVAHDLNNTLGPMVALPALVAERFPKDDPAREELAMIGESARRAAVVIQDLLSLARRGNYACKPMWLNPLVDVCLKSPAFLDRINDVEAIAVSVDLTEGLPPINGSEPHLMQAILNVLINGVEAMNSEGGTLTVRTANETLDSKTGLLVDCEPGDYVALRIQDSGCGIELDQIQRIIEPFHSSKPMGKSGSGLGLAVVYGVMEDHRAGLRVETALGDGTCFVLYFPQSKELPVDNSDEIFWSGSEKILVVDDVESQRSLTERLLKLDGYTPTSACNGHDAVELVRAYDFDAVILDMIMEEGFDGLDTYRELLRLKPGIRCIIATGYSDSSRVAEAKNLGASSCLSKPFSRPELSQAVRAALDHEPKAVALGS